MGAVQELDWCNAAGSRAGRAEQLRPTEHKVRCLFFPFFFESCAREPARTWGFNQNIPHPAR